MTELKELNDKVKQKFIAEKMGVSIATVKSWRKKVPASRIDRIKQIITAINKI